MSDATETSSATCPCCKRLKLGTHTILGRRLDFFCYSCGASFDAEYIRDFEEGVVRVLGHLKNPKYVDQFGKREPDGKIKIDPRIPMHLETYVLEEFPMKEHPNGA